MVESRHGDGDPPRDGSRYPCRSSPSRRRSTAAPGDAALLLRRRARRGRGGRECVELQAAPGQPFYHVALLVPGDRFDAALAWAEERVRLLPERETGEVVFDFAFWDALACYFHDPAGTIVELIAHRGVGEAGSTGPFRAEELLGLSEVGIVGDPPADAAALESLGLAVWDGMVEGERSLAFVGEQARTLILCRAGRPWLPTGRPAEPSPVDVELAGGPRGSVELAERLRVSSARRRRGCASILIGAIEHEEAEMARPVTMFTGQWADLPLDDLAAKLSSWGFDGAELACWGDHFEVDKAVADPAT